ncbi:hypothetical protein Cob_v008624 [Colletotrichum orbiculare MAFF 240422]|uniref:Uncharacterized protein n=1 Tax=Colletotrichum orbiculare (strain 104-T / ATCC 96160 / CBS 514.97 / LARS 414 / MAFF 240422) TaxID=1213857 RepID=A0A484FJL3_COLOR|nr:hypothetical protein Cob_v008624 [Colletotrichum orbiculare MAFF 240422]
MGLTGLVRHLLLLGKYSPQLGKSIRRDEVVSDGQRRLQRDQGTADGAGDGEAGCSATERSQEKVGGHDA